MGFNHQPAAAYIGSLDEQHLKCFALDPFVDDGNLVLDEPVPLLQCDSGTGTAC